LLNDLVEIVSCPIEDRGFVNSSKKRLEEDGALIIPEFLNKEVVSDLVKEAKNRQHMAFYTKSTHNVYLTPKSEEYKDDHIFNKQIISSKGCITTDQIPEDSYLKTIYKSNIFKKFIANLVDEKVLYEYEDPLSSINVHYASEGQELGWHFDNSSFAVTLLLQKPIGGGVFEYFKDVRNSEKADFAFEKVESIVQGILEPSILKIEPGTLVLFKGRNSIHRVTPTIGDLTRYLVVFAYNSKPGVSLSKSAQKTFYGRIAE
jgi:hypothetical protein